jgi:hypothetical protein
VVKENFSIIPVLTMSIYLIILGKESKSGMFVIKENMKNKPRQREDYLERFKGQNI